MPVSLTLYLGANVWIIGLVNDNHLKMVKIEITGPTTYNWVDTRYQTPYTEACAAQATFDESCFIGTPRSNIYPVDLDATQS